MSLPSESITEHAQESFLIFHLGNELYGASLTSIKEVLKVGEIKPVPYMKPYYKGVMNLRGQIIGVIDLREKFELKKDEENALILVVEHSLGLIGAIVDGLESVHVFQESEIDKNPMLETKIPIKFFQGVAKNNERLVNIIDLAGTLTHEDLRTVKSLSA